RCRAKRSARRVPKSVSICARLFQLLLEKGENLARRIRGSRAAFLVENLHFARVVAIFHEHAILLCFRIGRGAPERELAEKTVVLLVERVRLRIDVPHEVETLRAVRRSGGGRARQEERQFS